MNFRRQRVRGIDQANQCFGAAISALTGVNFGGMRKDRRGLGHPLVQQQFRGFAIRVRQETPLHGASQHLIRQRQKAHPLVMRHERPHHRATLPSGNPRGRVVHRLVEAVASHHAVIREPLDILTGGFWIDHQGHDRGVRRHHKIVSQSALKAQAWNAKCAILIIQMRVGHVVAGLGGSPRHASLVAILHLPRHHRAVGLIEQRFVVCGHHQQRHQVFKHRAAPGKQRRSPSRRRQISSQGEPCLLRKLPLRNGHKAAQPRLRRQQVIEAGIPPAIRDIKSNRKLFPRLVE